MTIYSQCMVPHAHTIAIHTVGRLHITNTPYDNNNTTGITNTPHANNTTTEI